MAKRLATEYVKASLQLKEEEILKFVEKCSELQVTSEIKVFENGNHEVILKDMETDEDIVLPFERRKEWFVTTDCSFRFNSRKLADTMRRAIAHFKGNAIVHRVYSNYTIVYHYFGGNVVKIVEISNTTESEKIIYEFKDSARQLQKLYAIHSIEHQIVQVQQDIDLLLDLRNHDGLSAEAEIEIDRKLAEKAHQLFVLEA